MTASLIAAAVISFAAAVPHGSASARPPACEPSGVRWSEPRTVAGLRDWTTVAVGANPRAVIVAWVAPGNGGLGEIFVRRAGARAATARAVRLDDSARASGGPSVAFSGRAVCVAWHDAWDFPYREPGPKIAARLRCSDDLGVTWGPVRRVDADGGRLVSSGKGLLLIDHAGGHYRSRMSTDLGRTWTSPVAITTEARHIGGSAVWRDRQGLFFAYERGSEAARAIVLRRSFDDGQTWSRPRVVAQGPDVRFPEIAGDGSGRLVAAWWDGRGNRLFTSVSTDRGRSWSEPVRINRLGVTQVPFALTATSGGFVAVWGRRQARVNGDLWSASSADGREWSTATTLAGESERAYSIVLAAAGSVPVLAYASSEQREVLIRRGEFD